MKTDEPLTKLEERKIFGKQREAKKGMDIAREQYFKIMAKRTGDLTREDLKRAQDYYSAYQDYKKLLQQEEKDIRREELKKLSEELERIKASGKR